MTRLFRFNRYPPSQRAAVRFLYAVAAMVTVQALAMFRFVGGGGPIDFREVRANVAEHLRRNPWILQEATNARR